MTYQNILTQLKENILYVTINRESKLNALNKATLDELADVIDMVTTDPEIRGVLLTGAGEKAFVAGADIAEFQHYTPEEGKELAHKGHLRVFDAIANCPKPWVAAINGFALGGGLELAMACSIRVAAEHAKMGLPEVTLGLIPGYGGTQRLVQLIGRGNALELIVTADMVAADRALQMGLVNHVVAKDQLLVKAEEILGKIKLRAPLAITSAIRAINAGLNPQMNGYESEIEEFARCFGTRDFKEGVSAFLEKRAASFKGV